MDGGDRQLAPGDVFAGCRIEELVGRGGMGLVYRARQLRPERPVAVKVILPAVAGDSEFRRRFEQEASLAAQIAHPNVIPIYGVGEEESLLYIVMRFVENMDLRELVRSRGRLAPRHAARCVTQIAGALDAAHARGLVHRDVKPANVLVAGEGPDEHLYLTDFGLARRVSAFGAGPTRHGDFVGTLDYSPPEQILGDEVDARSDVYALGATLYQLVTGVVPFPREQDAQKYHAHLELTPPQASDMVPTVPVGLGNVVIRAMAKDPGDRFQSAGELARAATYEAGKPPPPPPPRRPTPLPSDDPPPSRTATLLLLLRAHAPQRPRTTAGLAAIVIGLLVVVIVVWLRPPSGASALTQPAIDGAVGPVTYCTGADSVPNKAGPTAPHQHSQSVANFNALPNNYVHATLKPFSEDASQQYQQFSRDLRSNHTCDVFYSDVIWTADFANNHWLTDLSPYFNGVSLPSLTSFVPAMQAAAAFGGKDYGVPKQADAGLLYYRKDLFPSPPLTWQSLVQAAEPGKTLRFQGEDYEGLTVNFLELAYAAGAQPIITPDHKANLDQQPERDALQLMVDGINDHAVPRIVVDQEEQASTSAFQHGSAFFMRNWSPVYAQLQTTPKVAHLFGVAPLPVWNDHPAVSVLGGHMLVVAAATKHLAAALKLVEYLSSGEVMATDATDFALAPARADLWSDPRVELGLPAFKDLRKAIFNAEARPITPNYGAVSEAISSNVNEALRGHASVAQALDMANYEMQQALDVAYPPGH